MRESLRRLASEEAMQPPRRAGRRRCAVELIDGETLDLDVQRKAKGGELLDLVCQHLGVDERDYFGLQHAERGDPRVWVDLNRRLSKTFKNSPWEVRLAVKFYPPEPADLAEDITRDQLMYAVRRDLIEDCADHCCGEPDHRSVLDNLYSDIVTALQAAAKVSRGGSKGVGRGPRIVGWNKHVSAAHREARSRFHEWLLSGKPSSGCVYDDMRSSRKVFKSRLKWCQDHQDQIKMDALAEKHERGNFRTFWKTTSKMNPRPGLPVSVGGVSDPKDIANLFRDQFNINSPLGPARTMPNVETHVQKMSTRFTAKEIAKVIRSISRGKSPGHDGLSIEHLQYAGPHISRVLAMFFTLCVRHLY
ncbi:unnamed protein product [Plutella xylostella]|uniref:(diamondback moth) hypothetical protein n=1 Tax=Plutella xylostella TaxID=51655 RepID=A0A8S4FU81_PLUXY|nr:unnamed protein product [Plutella xylostella]